MGTKEEVSIDKIEEELSNLWESSLDKNKIKACLFNLVVFSHRPERTEYFSSLIRQILEKLPCRIIFIKSDDRTSENRLKVSVSTDLLGDEKKHVACDQVLIEVSGEERNKVPFIVLPLLVPDLPVYVIWGKDPGKEDYYLNKLVKTASAVIFDSETAEDIQQYCQNILELIALDQAKIMDMKWAHVSRWQKIVTKIFDTDERISDLEHIHSLTIEYVGQAAKGVHHDQIQTLFLTGWIATRLGWTFSKIELHENKTRIVFDEGREVLLVPKTSDQLPSDSLLKIHLITKQEKHYKIARLKDYPKVLVKVYTSSSEEPSFTLPLPSMDKQITFVKELFYEKTSKQYCETLEFLASVKWGKCHD